VKTSVITRADSDLGVTRSLPFFFTEKFNDQISTKILVQKDFFLRSDIYQDSGTKRQRKFLEVRSDSVVPVKTREGNIIIWLLCRLLRPLLGAETWDRRCACASGWSIYGLQPLKAGRGDSLVPLVQLLSIGNLVRTEVKLAAAAAVPLVKYAAEETTMASRDDSWRQETDPAGRSTAAPRRTIRTQEPARIKARLCN